MNTTPISPKIINDSSYGPKSLSSAEKGVVEKANKVAQDFESIFLGMMLKSMRASVPEGELLDSGQGGKVFEEMLDTEYAKIMAKQSMSDLAKSIASEMLKAMSHQQGLTQKIEGLRAYSAEQQAITMGAPKS